MAIFAVSFRMHQDASRQERWASLVEAIHRFAVEGPWEETTSFALFECAKTAEDLCDALYFGSQFDSSKDLMLVLNLSAKDQAVKGPVAYPHTLAAYLNAR